MTLIERYIAGWRTHDKEAILATLAPDCVVIESFGPTYRGPLDADLAGRRRHRTRP
ncbi:hypothetical protein ACH0BU_12710 [Sphingomonas olei]